jgi:Holliday junction resolvase-like predicted endonuclease
MLTKQEAAKMSCDQKGLFAERRAMKILKTQGYDVSKIDERQACNDFIITKGDKQFVVEIKGASDWGYTDFFCEVASKKAKATEWEPSFWLSQRNISFFAYFSFSEDTLYLYDGALFREKTFAMMSDKKTFDISAGTGKGFCFKKRDIAMGFLGSIKL